MKTIICALPKRWSVMHSLPLGRFYFNPIEPIRDLLIDYFAISGHACLTPATGEDSDQRKTRN